MNPVKEYFGKCDRCAWRYNGGCSEWNRYEVLHNGKNNG